MKKAPTFEEGVKTFKEDIKSGKIKATPDFIGRFAQIFATTPTLKLDKKEDIKTSLKKKPRSKRGLIKINLFNRISW